MSEESKTMTFPQSLTIQINSVYGEEKKVLQKLDEVSSSFLNLKNDFNEFKAAVAEACINAIEHGNLESAIQPILVTIEVNEHTMKGTVCDKGKGFNPMIQNDVNTERGWGLKILDNFVDDWTIFHLEDGEYTFCIQFEKSFGK